MASILKVDEMQGVTSAGDITITSEGGSATQSLQQGVAKSWAHVSQSSTQTLDDSLNVASITDGGTGETSCTFTNTMGNSNWCASVSPGSSNADNRHIIFNANNTTRLKMEVYQVRSASLSAVDADDICGVVHGDLA